MMDELSKDKLKELLIQSEELFQSGQYKEALIQCMFLAGYFKRYGDSWQRSSVLNRLAYMALLFGDAEAAALSHAMASDLSVDDGKFTNYQSMLLCLHYRRQERSVIADLHKKYATILPEQSDKFSHDFPRGEKIRLGYLSADFRRQVMLNFIKPFVENYDHDRFEVYCYMTGAEDIYSAALKEQVDKWYSLHAVSADEIARQINEDGIEILVDFNGHSAGSNMAVLAQRPAPVQISGLGYVDLLGLPYIDYVWADKVVYSIADEQLFGDNMIIMPESMFCFKPFMQAALPKRYAFEKNGYVTFGSFNRFAKITDAVLAAWGKIMRAVPNSKLLLKDQVFLDEAFCLETKQHLQAFGIFHVELRPVSAEYLPEYGDVDIALDTFPANGGGTTCDALYMGVPVIGLTGTDYGSNYGASILKAAGLGELVASDISDYIKLAVVLAHDKLMLGELKKNLRACLLASPLMDADAYMRDVEAAYQQLRRQ